MVHWLEPLPGTSKKIYLTTVAGNPQQIPQMDLTLWNHTVATFYSYRNPRLRQILTSFLKQSMARSMCPFLVYKNAHLHGRRRSNICIFFTQRPSVQKFYLLILISFWESNVSKQIDQRSGICPFDSQTSESYNWILLWAPNFDPEEIIKKIRILLEHSLSAP